MKRQRKKNKGRLKMRRCDESHSFTCTLERNWIDNAEENAKNAGE
jgi:hypothetical protein